MLVAHPAVLHVERSLVLLEHMNPPFSEAKTCIFRHLQHTTFAGGDPTTITKGYSLSQNSSSWFNPATTIRFFLPNENHVGLRIFNILGEEVAALVSGTLRAGVHSIQWNAVGVPSGVYFYRLQAGGFMETRNLVVLR